MSDPRDYETKLMAAGRRAPSLLLAIIAVSVVLPLGQAAATDICTRSRLGVYLCTPKEIDALLTILAAAAKRGDWQTATGDTIWADHNDQRERGWRTYLTEVGVPTDVEFAKCELLPSGKKVQVKRRDLQPKPGPPPLDLWLTFGLRRSDKGCRLEGGA